MLSLKPICDSGWLDIVASLDFTEKGDQLHGRLSFVCRGESMTRTPLIHFSSIAFVVSLFGAHPCQTYSGSIIGS